MQDGTSHQNGLPSFGQKAKENLEISWILVPGFPALTMLRYATFPGQDWKDWWQREGDVTQDAQKGVP